MAAEKNRPAHQYRLGEIVGTVWFNEDDNGRGTHTVQIAQLYRPSDEDGLAGASSLCRDSFLHACESRNRRLRHYTHGGAMVYHPFQSAPLNAPFWDSRTQVDRRPRCPKRTDP